ncbi:MAG TPA: methionyl-tRNA formyltransferase [Dehalococcoidia bacterium]|nr:methionyl-tRNA formyltransferase [Dehalococcoidia bacterium]
MTILFIGTPAFAVPSLQRLVADGHAIAAVITQPDRPAGRGRRERPSPIKVAALEMGLPILQPESLRDAAALAEVRALNPECAVAVAYGQILRPDFLSIPPRGVVNVHPSLLPKYRGASPIPAAILAGDDITGVTIMLMDAGMDSGPILAQRIQPITPEDSAASLSDALAVSGAGLLAETLPAWLRGEIQPIPQDDSTATKTTLLRKEDGAINWHHPAGHIWRQVRACNPWPGAHTHFQGDTIHIWRAWPLDEPISAAPGTVVALTAEQRALAPEGPPFAVVTGDGLLAVREAQRSGRRALPAAEFLRGMPALIGSRLD